MDFLGGNVHTHLDFTGCDFTNADFTVVDAKTKERTGLILQACKFNGCILDGAIFAYCDVRWSDFTGAKGIDNVIISDFTQDGNIVGGSATQTEGCVGL